MVETLYYSLDFQGRIYAFKKNNNKDESKRKRRVGRRRDHCCQHSTFLKAPLYGLTDANKIIPGNTVSYLEASIGMPRLPDTPHKLK